MLNAASTRISPLGFTAPVLHYLATSIVLTLRTPPYSPQSSITAVADPENPSGSIPPPPIVTLSPRENSRPPKEMELVEINEIGCAETSTLLLPSAVVMAKQPSGVKVSAPSFLAPNASFDGVVRLMILTSSTLWTVNSSLVEIIGASDVSSVAVATSPVSTVEAHPARVAKPTVAMSAENGVSNLEEITLVPPTS